MTRVVAWVRALTTGRRRVVAHAPRPSMVLALRPAAAPTPASVFNAFSTVRQHRELHRHEHRHLTLVRPAQVVTAATSAAPPAAVVTRTLHSHPLERATPVPGPATVRAVVDRVVEKHQRVEGPARPLRALPVSGREAEPLGEPRSRLRGVPVPAAAVAPTPAPTSPGAAMVLRRPAAVSGGEAPAGRELASPSRPGATAAIDVEFLTDRVVAQIDRRIVAHRERLGQI
jgi:hypothetical protein